MTPDADSESDQCALPARAVPQSGQSAPRWMWWTLIAAGAYNLVWGTLVVVLPTQPFAWLGMTPPNYPELWQCLGMIVGVYGVGYWIAARDPARHWPIVLVGWLGKVLGPIGFLRAAAAGDLPWAFGLVNVTNDLGWLLPFTAILVYAWRTNSAPDGSQPLSLNDALNTVRSQRGNTLGELSATRRTSIPLVQSGADNRDGCPTGGVLVVFIRHAGCTFCREALAELAADREQLAASGLKLAVGHMSASSTAATLLARYGLDDVDHFSDPDCRLFRAFDLARGSLWQVLGPEVWLRALPALAKYGLGRIDGDGFQLGGAFLIRDGKVVAAKRLQSSAERIDFAKLAKAA